MMPERGTEIILAIEPSTLIEIVIAVVLIYWISKLGNWVAKKVSG